MKNSNFLVITFFHKKNCEFYFNVYLAYLHDWFGKLMSFSLIFDALSEFGVEIDQNGNFCAFLKKVEK